MLFTLTTTRNKFRMHHRYEELDEINELEYGIRLRRSTLYTFCHIGDAE